MPFLIANNIQAWKERAKGFLLLCAGDNEAADRYISLWPGGNWGPTEYQAESTGVETLVSCLITQKCRGPFVPADYLLICTFQNFDSDISSVGIDGCWQADSQRILNEVMVEHFFRQGMLDVAEELCQVTINVDVECHWPWKIMLCVSVLIWVFQVTI